MRRPPGGLFDELHSGEDGNKPFMSLHNSRIRGIVEVMDDQEHAARGEALGSALHRLSTARAQRGPVGVLDPFEVVAPEQRHITELPRANRRRGLFSFSDRARAASELDT